MSDLIEEAVGGWQDTKQRKATGSVGGYRVSLIKKEYYKRQRGPTAWSVSVYINGVDHNPETQVKDLTASEAQAEFERLVEKHNLQEQQSWHLQ